jgi:hypothetical protein
MYDKISQILNFNHWSEKTFRAFVTRSSHQNEKNLFITKDFMIKDNLKEYLRNDFTDISLTEIKLSISENLHHWRALVW